MRKAIAIAVLALVVPAAASAKHGPPPLAATWAPGVELSYTETVTDGLGPFTWSVSSGTLPAGLSFNTTTATISGIPTTQQVNVAFTIQVTDSSNPQQSVASFL